MFGDVAKMSLRTRKIFHLRTFANFSAIEPLMFYVPTKTANSKFTTTVTITGKTNSARQNKT